MARGTNRGQPGLPAPEPLWRIAVYIRLSREDGSDESLSVTNQRKIVLEFIGRYFQGQDHALTDLYIDDGRTGTTQDARPEFQRMSADIASKRVNCVICKTLSRAFRNYADQGRFLEEFLPACGCRFISVSDPFMDTYADPSCLQNMEVPINGLMNDRYAAKTSADVRRTFDTKRRRGEFIGAFAPYGYRKDPDDRNRLLEDGEAAQVVRDIFRWFVTDGMSKRGIARRLNELGILNPSAYKRSKGLKFKTPQGAANDGLWSPSSIDRILRDPIYAGVLRQGRQRVVSYKVHARLTVPRRDWFMVEGAAPAIIPPELFQTAQELHRRHARTAPGQSTLHLFSGMVFCADCGKGMHRRTANGLSYYACRTYTEKSRARCAKHTIREDVLAGVVLAAVQTQIGLAASLPQLIDQIGRAPAVHTRQARLEALREQRARELDKLSDRLDGLYEDWKDGDLSREQYRRMKDRYGEQAALLREQLARIEEDLRTLAEGAGAEDPYLTAFLRHRNVECLTRGLLVELVHAIRIHAGGEVEIQFDFTDPLQRIGGLPQGGEAPR